MRALPFAALAACALAAGCSLILQTADPIQCSTQRDCDGNPSFNGRVCTDGFCVVPSAPIVPVSNEAGAGCVTSAICTQQNSGKASVCKTAGGPCTPWQTPQCNLIHGPWDNPNVFVVGTILPFAMKQVDGSLATIDYTDRLRRAIDLAADDFAAAATAGIPVPGVGNRPFAVLHCDSELDPTLAKAAMTHLTDVVGAQAIIVGADQDLAAVAEQAIAKKPAIACSDCVAALPPGVAAWRVVPSIALEAPMAAWRVNDIEAKLAAGPSPPTTLKVAVLETPDPGPKAFVDALVGTLHFNGGKSVAQNGSAFTVEMTEDASKQAVNYIAHADALAAFQPDVVVIAMGAEFPIHYLQLLEAKWTTSKPKPYYVMTTLNFEASPFATVIGAGDDDVRKRLSGTRPGYDATLQANIDAFTIHYKTTYNFKAPDGNYSGYDAFYATAYAMIAATNGITLDGPHVSAGFERLRNGTTIDFRPNQIGLGLTLLGSAANEINVRGLTSGLDWNVTTHDITVPDLGIYCLARSGDGSIVIQPDTGPRMQTSSGTVTGTYTCD